MSEGGEGISLDERGKSGFSSSTLSKVEVEDGLFASDTALLLARLEIGVEEEEEDVIDGRGGVSVPALFDLFNDGKVSFKRTLDGSQSMASFEFDNETAEAEAGRM